MLGRYLVIKVSCSIVYKVGRIGEGSRKSGHVGFLLGRVGYCFLSPPFDVIHSRYIHSSPNIPIRTYVRVYCTVVFDGLPTRYNHQDI